MGIKNKSLLPLQSISKVLSSEKIDIRTFHHKIAAALAGTNFPSFKHQTLADFDYFAKSPPTETKTNPTNHAICIKTKFERNLDISVKNTKIILL